MKKILISILFLLLLIPFNVNASDKVINLHLFYGAECPHCEAEMTFLNSYLKDQSNVKLYKYEVWHNTNNQNKLLEIKDLLNNSDDGVPFLVIGSKVIVGYADGITDETIKDTINYYQTHNYKDTVGRHLGMTVYDDEKEDKDTSTIKPIPILGKVDVKKVSLPLVAIVIGLVDGFNPCAMWILIFLISILLGMKDRKKMFVLGLTFIATSGIVYALFMVSWLNFAVFIKGVSYVQYAIGLVALVFGIINIRNYLKKRKEPDGCEVVNDKKRVKIIDRIKKIVNEKKFILALLGVTALAFSVNLIELFCSLGLPATFTQILAINDLSVFEYAVYIILYILFFLIDDIIIFIIAMSTSKIKGISNKYSKYSHLIGGIIMILIGLLMIIKPEWLMFNF